MTSKAITIDDYINELPENRKTAIQKLRAVILENLPENFSETMNYGMPCIVVPHSIYPNGYHCKPTDPLPFLSYASQKNSINFYHMGIYANKNLYDWFVEEYPKHCKTKLDMGKSCIRFKKSTEIPFDLLGELVKKLNVNDWISLYESSFIKK